eukprot:1340597-Amorphochlora_amoeboformis.AAC.1
MLAEPKKTGRTKKVCYGLEARIANETHPEMIISDDPKDPIFYSSCYLRSKAKEWIPLPYKPKELPSFYTFGGHCLDCWSFIDTLSLPIEQTPHWYLNDSLCEDCFYLPQSWAPTISVPISTPTPTKYPTTVSPLIAGATYAPTGPTAFPTPAPTVAVNSAWKVEITVAVSIDEVNASFEARFKKNLALYLGIDPSLIEIKFSAASVKAE